MQTLTQGKVLDGRYRILRELSAGGFGQTYLAQDTRRPGEPQCVVKQLKPVSQDPDVLSTARRLFQREAETLERLGDHDQIPRLLAYFEDQQEFYLVQDYIDGHGLNEELKNGQPWHEKAVVEFLLEILPILEFVHSTGSIHRDIKPDNIFRRHSDRRLMLIDFGAVKEIQLHTTFTSEATVTPTVAIGTPGYMSSEQARGRPHFGSDIYALGVIAIQAITGVRPQNFRYDPQTGEIVWKQDLCSPGLAAVLNRMVTYHFRDRYQSAREVYNVLTQLQPKPAKTTLPPVQTSNPVTASTTNVPTQAVAGVTPPPSSRPSQPTSRPPQTPPPQKRSNSPNLPLLVLSSLVVIVVSVVLGATIALNNLTRLNLGGNSSSEEDFSSVSREGENNSNDKTCVVIVDGGLRVRQTPNGKIIGGVKPQTKLTLSGRESLGWLEITAPTKGWVYGDEEYVKCTSSGFVTADEPAEKPTQPRNNSSSIADQGKKLFDRAKSQLEDGNIQNAIDQLKSVAPDSEAYREAQNALMQWTQIQERYQAMQEAVSDGRWDDILADVNTNGYPDSSYWRKQFQTLVEQAREAKQEATSAPSPVAPAPQAAPPPETVKPPVEEKVEDIEKEIEGTFDENTEKPNERREDMEDSQSQRPEQNNTVVTEMNFSDPVIRMP